MTKYLYANWLKKLIVYSFQLIILFASLAFLGSMVRDEIYASLGFKVCQLPIIDLGVTEKPLLSMYYPDPKTASSFNKSLQPQNLTNIAVPKPKTTYTSIKNDDGSVSYATNFQPAYTYKEDRYLDLPFLDPTNARDAERLDRFRHKGITVDFVGLLELILITLILYKFNDSTINIANTIIGDSSGSGVLLGVSNSIGKDVGHYQKRVSSAISAKLQSNRVVNVGIGAYNSAKYSIRSAKNQLRRLAQDLRTYKSSEKLESLDKKQQHLDLKYNLNKLKFKKAVSRSDQLTSGVDGIANSSSPDDKVGNIGSSIYQNSINFIQDLIDPQLAQHTRDRTEKINKMHAKSLQDQKRLTELQSWQKEKAQINDDYKKDLGQLNNEQKKSRTQLLSALKQNRDRQLNALDQKYDSRKDF